MHIHQNKTPTCNEAMYIILGDCRCQCHSDAKQEAWILHVIEQEQKPHFKFLLLYTVNIATSNFLFLSLNCEWVFIVQLTEMITYRKYMCNFKATAIEEDWELWTWPNQDPIIVVY